MDPLQNRYFLFIRKAASFLGVWPAQTYKERVLRYFTLSFVLISFILIQLFCQLYTWDFNLRSLVFVFQFVIPDVCCLVQYAATIIYLSKVEKVINILKLDWQRLKNDDELRIMRKHTSQTIICTIVCGFLLILFIGLLILPSLLRRILSANGEISDSYRFPVFFCLNHFLDAETLYYPVVIYEIIFSITVVSVALCCYSLYFTLVQHICSRLSIVKCELRRPFINNRRNKKPMDLSRWVIDIIQHLARIKEYVKLLNIVGEKNYFLQVTLAFFLLVIDFLCLLQIPVLLEQEGGKNDVLISVIFIISNLLPIYVSCYIGQRLIDYSEDVYKEACLLPIHEISLDTQKLLLMTLIMHTKPYTITIGKIFVSSHQFFSDLLRVSLSFSMMLHSTQKM